MDESGVRLPVGPQIRAQREAVDTSEQTALLAAGSRTAGRYVSRPLGEKHLRPRPRNRAYFMNVVK